MSGDKPTSGEELLEAAEYAIKNAVMLGVLPLSRLRAIIAEHKAGGE